ncbi:MAG: hypothetical protein IJO06_14270 [Thermoguttaceae bacterium]|nr:hypothetical protein [Thermoguttaceae bacterium]
MCWQNEPAARRQTYKLGEWTPDEGGPRRVVLYSSHTRRIFTPRLGRLPAIDLDKPVASLESAVKHVQTLNWDGDFEPVPGGWV